MARSFASAAVWLVMFGTAALAAADEITLTGRTMGTTYSIKLADGGDGADPAALQAEIDAELERINDIASTYRPDSELSRFNRSDSTQWYDVSFELALLVKGCLLTSELTGGAFDPTIAPLVDLWNFGPEMNPHDVPSDAEIAEALGSVGYGKLEARLDPPALRKSQPDLTVDLSASAKGYAAVKVSQLLASRGVEGRLVELGGEIQAAGRKADGTAWTIGIETPDPHGRAVFKRLPLRDIAVATSGDYRNFREVDGRRYSHLIDPRTGRPVEHTLASVTVAHESCEVADRLATAFAVMGPQAGLELARNSNSAALFIERTPGGFVERATPQFQRLLAAESESESGSVWPIFLAALIAFGLAVLGMAIGVIVSNRRLKGSCGGLAGLRDEQGRTMCEACTHPSPECQGVDAATDSAPESSHHKPS